MGTAQQHHVVQGGLPPVGPVHDVVGVAPGMGQVQARNRHRWSLSTTARRRPAETTGVRRPTSRGSEGPPSTTGSTEASQARRRAVAGETAPTWSGSHRPDPAQSLPPVWSLRRVCTSTVTVTWGRSPPTVGRSELSRYRWGQLAQGVGPSLGGGAQVPPSSRPELGIDHGLKRCQDGLSSLRVELSLHPDHPGRGGTDIEPASFPQGLGVAEGVPFVQRFRPLTDPPGEAPPPGGSGRLDQNCLRRPEGLRVLRSGLRQDPHRTRGPPLPERTPP